LMSFFDLKSDKSHPFANISNAPVLTLEEAESYYDDPEDETNLSVEARKWAKEVYEHWRSRRVQNGNRSLLSSLKFETGADTDDNDAYVCFRRREVRQARKTRGRDAQVTEKLKKLRRELEDARQLLISVNQREQLIKQRIETERQVFEQRSELKKVKVQQGIKGEKGEDEELLVNQRVSHDLVTVVVVRVLMLNSPRQSPDQQKPMDKDLRHCVFLVRGQKPSAQPRRTILCSCQTSRRKQLRRCSDQSRKRLASIANGTRIGWTILGDRSHHQPSLLRLLAICHASKRYSCRRLQLLCDPRHHRTTSRMSR
jgi:hypothetical protein